MHGFHTLLCSHPVAPDYTRVCCALGALGQTPPQFRSSRQACLWRKPRLAECMPEWHYDGVASHGFQRDLAQVSHDHTMSNFMSPIAVV